MNWGGEKIAREEDEMSSGADVSAGKAAAVLLRALTDPAAPTWSAITVL